MRPPTFSGHLHLGATRAMSDKEDSVFFPARPLCPEETATLRALALDGEGSAQKLEQKRNSHSSLRAGGARDLVSERAGGRVAAVLAKMVAELSSSQSDRCATRLPRKATRILAPDAVLVVLRNRPCRQHFLTHTPTLRLESGAPKKDPAMGGTDSGNLATATVM